MTSQYIVFLFYQSNNRKKISINNIFKNVLILTLEHIKYIEQNDSKINLDIGSKLKLNQELVGTIRSEEL